MTMPQRTALMTDDCFVQSNSPCLEVTTASNQHTKTEALENVLSATALGSSRAKQVRVRVSLKSHRIP